MAGPNFELITELQTVTRRDFPLADPTLLQPLGTTPLVDGEWLDLVQNAAGAQVLQRGTVSTYPLVFPIHTERGRYDTQAIGKATILMLGMYEAETKLYDPTSVDVGDPLVVVTSSSRRVLKTKTVADKFAAGDVIVGYVTKAAANGKIRFVHFGTQIVNYTNP